MDNIINCTLEILSFNFNYNIGAEGIIKLSLKGKVETFKPESENEKSVLLKITTEAKDQDERFLLKVTANVKYDFENKPENYDEYISEVCIPNGIEELYRAIDNVMIAMGHKPLNLSLANHTK